MESPEGLLLSVSSTKKMPETPTMIRMVGSTTVGGSLSSGPGKTMVTSAELPREDPGPGPGARGEEVGAERGGGAGPGLGGAERDGGARSSSLEKTASGTEAPAGSGDDAVIAGRDRVHGQPGGPGVAPSPGGDINCLNSVFYCKSFVHFSF